MAHNLRKASISHSKCKRVKQYPKIEASANPVFDLHKKAKENNE